MMRNTNNTKGSEKMDRIRVQIGNYDETFVRTEDGWKLEGAHDVAAEVLAGFDRQPEPAIYTDAEVQQILIRAFYKAATSKV
jgi:hypothetical protein